MSVVSIDTVHCSNWNATYVGNDPQLIRASNSYSITWNGVTHDHLSVTWLLMLVCFMRTEALDAIMVQEMEMLQRNTALIGSTCDAINLHLDALQGKTTLTNATSFSYTDQLGTHATTLQNYLLNVAKLSDGQYPGGTWSEPAIEKNMKALQMRQDELNQISQKTSINIETLITKREQIYLLDTTGIKRFFNDANSTAGNI